MNALTPFETKLADLYAKAPHLPTTGRRWIAANAWWITLVIAIISTIGLLAAIPSIFVIATAKTFATIYRYSNVPVSLLVTSAVISLAFGIISTIILFLAVKPLQSLRRRGWELLFLEQVVGIISAIVSFFVLIQNFNLLGLIWSLVFIAVELYFLFEIRSEFSGREAVVTEAEVVSEPIVEPVAASAARQKAATRKKPAAKKKPGSTKKK